MYVAYTCRSLYLIPIASHMLHWHTPIKPFSYLHYIASALFFVLSPLPSASVRDFIIISIVACAPRVRGCERERERARIERLGERERENGARSDPWEGFFSFSVSIIGSQEWKSIRKRRRTVSNAVRGVYSVSLKSHEKGRGKPGVGLVGTTREGGKVRNLF